MSGQLLTPELAEQPYPSVGVLDPFQADPLTADIHQLNPEELHAFNQASASEAGVTLVLRETSVQLGDTWWSFGSHPDKLRIAQVLSAVVTRRLHCQTGPFASNALQEQIGIPAGDKTLTIPISSLFLGRIFDMTSGEGNELEVDFASPVNHIVDERIAMPDTTPGAPMGETAPEQQPPDTQQATAAPKGKKHKHQKKGKEFTSQDTNSTEVSIDHKTSGAVNDGLVQPPRPRVLKALGVLVNAQAACLEVDPEIFFPERGRSNKPAKEVCGQCVVRLACLAYAVEYEKGEADSYGVRGGMSPKKRRKLTREDPNFVDGVGRKLLGDEWEKVTR